MLPTKGYFQDIECPFYNTNCGRPYCHFRHRKRPNEPGDDGIQDPTKNAVPTYKPTPKSELENIHNSRSHIPISYVPDLAFKRDRTVRPVRIQTATYKPTPLSILSSAAKPESSLSEKNLYNPLESDINFEALTNEFDLIDNIVHETEEGPETFNQLKANIEKEQDKLNLQLNVSKVVNDTREPRFSSDEEKLEVCTSKPSVLPESKSSTNIKLESEIKKEKPDSTTSCLPEKSDNSASEKSSRKIKKEDEKSSNKKSKSKDADSKSSSHHKSSKRESHRKEEKKGSSKDRHSTSRHKHKSKSPKPEKRHKHKSSSDSSSGLSSRDSTPDKGTKDNNKTSTKNKRESSSKSKSKSSSNTHDKKRKRSRSPSGESKGHERSDKKKRDDKEKSKSKSRSKDKLVDENKDKLRKHEKRHSKKPENAGKLFLYEI